MKLDWCRQLFTKGTDGQTKIVTPWAPVGAKKFVQRKFGHNIWGQLVLTYWSYCIDTLQWTSEAISENLYIFSIRLGDYNAILSNPRKYTKPHSLNLSPSELSTYCTYNNITFIGNWWLVRDFKHCRKGCFSLKVNFSGIEWCSLDAGLREPRESNKMVSSIKKP